MKTFHEESVDVDVECTEDMWDCMWVLLFLYKP